jgi:ferritin-like metal-binding protein YciE
VECKLADETLPKLVDEAQDEEFKAGLTSHLEQTRNQVKNVERVFAELGEEPEKRMRKFVLIATPLIAAAVALRRPVRLGARDVMP